MKFVGLVGRSNRQASPSSNRTSRFRARLTDPMRFVRTEKAEAATSAQLESAARKALAPRVRPTTLAGRAVVWRPAQADRTQDRFGSLGRHGEYERRVRGGRNSLGAEAFTVGEDVHFSAAPSAQRSRAIRRLTCTRSRTGGRILAREIPNWPLECSFTATEFDHGEIKSKQEATARSRLCEQGAHRRAAHRTAPALAQVNPNYVSRLRRRLRALGPPSTVQPARAIDA